MTDKTKQPEGPPGDNSAETGPGVDPRMAVKIALVEGNIARIRAGVRTKAPKTPLPILRDLSPFGR